MFPVTMLQSRLVPLVFVIFFIAFKFGTEEIISLSDAQLYMALNALM